MTELTQEQLAEIRGKLLPCPHCGSAAKLKDAYPYALVVCVNCGSRSMGAFAARAIEKWNSRNDSAHIDAQAARIAEREKPCVWTPEGEDSSSWNTGCGSSFWFDDGHEGVNFCPFCGHPAVFDHEGDEA